jgi:CBS domain containing-hemolysin-like protein
VNGGLSNFDLWLGVAVCVFFIAMSGLYSGTETGLYCLNRLRLRVAAHGGNRRAQLLQRLLADQPGQLFTLLIGTNVAHYLTSACLTLLLLKWFTARQSGPHAEADVEFYTTLILTPAVFIFGEIVPKNLFQRHSDRFMLAAARPLALSYGLVRWTGLLRMEKWISKRLLRKFAKKGAADFALHPRAEMYQLLHEGAAGGALTATQAVMLERIAALQGMHVGAVMVPLSAAVTLRADLTLDEARRTVMNTSHSWMPVYRSDRQGLVGVVHFLDILTGVPELIVEDYLWTPVELRPETRVIDALSALQRARRRMAFVVDASGRCQGIVTVKDLVEEIVGELAAW